MFPLNVCNLLFKKLQLCLIDFLHCPTWRSTPYYSGAKTFLQAYPGIKNYSHRDRYLLPPIVTKKELELILLLICTYLCTCTSISIMFMSKDRLDRSKVLWIFTLIPFGITYFQNFLDCLVLSISYTTFFSLQLKCLFIQETTMSFILSSQAGCIWESMKSYVQLLIVYETGNEIW